MAGINKSYDYLDDIDLDDINLDKFEMQIISNEMRRTEKTRLEKIKKLEARRKKKLRLLMQYCIQKLLGIFLIVLSILALKAGWFYEPSINSNDGTFLFIIVPISLYLIFTKDRCFK